MAATPGLVAVFGKSRPVAGTGLNDAATAVQPCSKEEIDLTIRKKIFTAGAVIFIILVILAVMNIRMHQRVVSNLQLRDQVNHHLAQIRAYVKWENDLVRLISEAVASGHSPPLLTEQLAQPPDIEPQERQVLVTSAQ